MKRERIRIKGMAGEQDAERVSALLHDVWGIRQVDVTLTEDRAEAAIAYDEQAASLHDFEQALIQEGFQVEGRA